MESLIEQTITGILDSLGVSYTGIAQVEVAGQRVFSITSEDTRFLIGPHGDTIHAIDFLVKKIADEKAKGEKVEPCVFDV
jgi:predicted RNA-binding protein Jag